MTIPYDALVDVSATEQWLREALRGRRLVCEVGLDERSRRQLLDLLRSTLAAECGGQYSRLGRRFPALLVAAVATDAAHAYTAGDLWSHLDADGGSPAEIGQAFARAIADLSLERFEVFDEQGAHRYVSRILAHGGVPVHCLTDLFRLIDHARHRGIGDATEVLELIADGSQWQRQIDRPVLRFLRDTGRVGRDFLERVLELPDEADSLDDDEHVADRLGLPSHVVRAYRRYEPAEAPAASVHRLARPRVLFDPDMGDAPELLLPWNGGTVAVWRILHEHGAEVSPVDVPPASADDVRVPVAPAARWRALALDADGQLLRAFSIVGVSEVHPVLVFDVETGEPPADPRFAPGREVWVIAPCLLSATGPEVEVLRSFPMADVAWSGWFVHDVVIQAPGELSGTHRLQPIWIRLGIEEDVRVQFDNLLDRVTAIDGRRVFAGAPVLTDVPWTEADADRWQLTIDGPAVGHHALVAGTDLSRVNAGLAALLPDDRVIEMVLRLRGPVGAGYRLPALVVPGLSVTVPDAPLLPGDAATVRLAAADQITLRYQGEPVSELSVQASTPRVTLTAEDSAGGFAELTFRCPAVRWRLAEGTAGSASFGGSVIRRTVTRGQRVYAVLQLDTGYPASVARLIADGVDGSIPLLPQVRHRDHLLRFDLSKLIASLLDAETASLRVDAEIDGRRCCVLELTEALVLALRSMEYAVHDGRPVLTYALEQTKALADRCIRITSLDRPWSRPMVVRIEQDAAAGRIGSSRLRAGRYTAIAGLEVAPGIVRVVATHEPIAFEVPWDAGTAAPDQTDERERLVELVHGAGTPQVPIKDPEGVAPAAALLLGSFECRSDAAQRIGALLPLPLLGWIRAFDEAAEQYGMTATAVVRAATRVLARRDRATDLAPETGTMASRLLRMAAIGRTGTGDVSASEALRALAGITADIPLQPDDILGANAGRATLQKISSELRELEQLPSTPLSANGRVLGLMRVRQLAHTQPAWVLTLARHYPVAARDLDLLPPQVRGMCTAARRMLDMGAFADGIPTLHLHVYSFEAAAHLVHGTTRALAVSEYLASVARTFPEYVETRIAFFLCYQAAPAARRT